MKIITTRDQIPEHMTQTEAAEFWSNHTLSDELLESSIIEEEDPDLPKRKSTTISIRLDEDLLQRIRTLAKQRNKGYQTLIKQFLTERTYEEVETKAPRIREKSPLPYTTVEQQPLEQQLEAVFRVLQEELSQLVSGIIFVQIRNNQIGKFGIRTLRTLPLEESSQANTQGLTELQRRSLLKHAIETLKQKTNWTNGEIHFEFAMRHNELCVSTQYESNYNLLNQFVL